jgi:hypothetical protein
MPTLRSTLATWLLLIVVPHRDVEVIVGDLEEEFAARAAILRHQWYWGQVARSMRALLWEPIQQTGCIAAGAIAILACVLQVAVECIVAGLAYTVETLGGRWPTTLGAIVVVCSLAAFGYASARLRRGAGTAFAIVAAAVLTIELLLGIALGRGMSLATLVALAVAPASALAGGQAAEKSRPAA